MIQFAPFRNLDDCCILLETGKARRYLCRTTTGENNFMAGTYITVLSLTPTSRRGLVHRRQGLPPEATSWAIWVFPSSCICRALAGRYWFRSLASTLT